MEIPAIVIMSIGLLGAVLGALFLGYYLGKIAGRQEAK